MAHIIWDWNGTLLHDQLVVLDAVNASLADGGWSPITIEDYRTHYTRPVRAFYGRVVGRPIGDAEWHRIDRVFHEAYHKALSSISLAEDAVEALSIHDASGRSQSLLSMYAHQELVGLVDQFDLSGFFTHVNGRRGASGDTKAASLAAHLGEALPTWNVVVVGDTPDDHEAADANGVPCVLYDGGSHHRADLERCGVPVASSLTEAAQLAVEVSRP